MANGASATALAAALALSLQGCTTPTSGPLALSVQSHPDGRELARMAVDAKDGFSLTFIHSVTLDPIVAYYTVTECAIVQTSETFTQHGPGLPYTADAPGMTWKRRGDVFVLTMRRSIPDLVVRADPEFRNRLDADTSVDLTRWGRRALRITPIGCVAGK